MDEGREVVVGGGCIFEADDGKGVVRGGIL